MQPTSQYETNLTLSYYKLTTRIRYLTLSIQYKILIVPEEG